MKKFSELNVGQEFFSTCSISEKELDSYLGFSRVKNILLDNFSSKKNHLISGRAILSRIEGEFTRLNHIYGNLLIFIGTDGDPDWALYHQLSQVKLKRISLWILEHRLILD